MKPVLSKIKQKIIHFFHRVFRYRLGAVYMLSGYVLSFIVLFNGISIYLSMEDALDAVAEQSYSSRTVLEPDGILSMEKPELYIQALKSLPCRVTLEDVMMFSDEEYVVRLVDVVIYDPDAEGQTGCIIGDELEQYTVEQDGIRYYSLDGCLYQVAEVADGKGGSLSYTISIPYDILEEASVSVLKTYMPSVSIVLESNTLDTGDCRTQLEELLSSLAGETVHLSAAVSDDNEDIEDESKLGIYLCIGAYIFCLINCIIVCEFWIFQRRKEIAIRRAYHFGDAMIRRLLFGDMMAIIAVALIIYLLLHVMIFSWVMEYFSAAMVLDIRSLLFMAAMVPVSAAVTILPHLRSLKKKSYAAGIRQG